MANKLQCPKNTSEWGKVLIEDLGERFNKLGEKIDNIKVDINDNTNTKIDEVRSDITAIKTTADSALRLAQQNETNLANLRLEVMSEINYLKYTCDKLTSENIKLKDNTDKLENYGRRDNIVFMGIPEGNNETKTEVERKTRYFLQNHLKLEQNVVDNIRFVRVHRLGAPKRDNTGKLMAIQKRPIIARFCKYSDRTIVWNARKNIDDTSVQISHTIPSTKEKNYTQYIGKPRVMPDINLRYPWLVMY